VLTIGRDAACGLRFESMTAISRRHATLTHEAASFVLADAGSTNGTLLNGRAVDAAAVRDGDLIQLGPRGPRLRVAIRAEAPLVTEGAEATVMPTARVPALVERVLYDPMRDKGRRYNPASLALILGMLGLGAFFGLFVALLSFFELGFGASLVGVVVAFAPAPLYLAVWLWLDRNDPEPAWVLGACLVWGGGAASADKCAGRGFDAETLEESRTHHGGGQPLGGSALEDDVYRKSIGPQLQTREAR
jgi:hypothetical protein